MQNIENILQIMEHENECKEKYLHSKIRPHKANESRLYLDQRQYQKYENFKDYKPELDMTDPEYILRDIFSSELFQNETCKKPTTTKKKSKATRGIIDVDSHSYINYKAALKQMEVYSKDNYEIKLSKSKLNKKKMVDIDHLLGNLDKDKAVYPTKLEISDMKKLYSDEDDSDSKHFHINVECGSCSSDTISTTEKGSETPTEGSLRDLSRSSETATPPPTKPSKKSKKRHVLVNKEMRAPMSFKIILRKTSDESNRHLNEKTIQTRSKRSSEKSLGQTEADNTSKKSTKQESNDGLHDGSTNSVGTQYEVKTVGESQTQCEEKPVEKPQPQYKKKSTESERFIPCECTSKDTCKNKVKLCIPKAYRLKKEDSKMSSEIKTQSYESSLQKKSSSREKSPKHSFGSGKSVQSHLSTPREQEQQEPFEQQTQSQEQSNLQKRSSSKERSPRHSFGSRKSVQTQQSQKEQFEKQTQSQEQCDLQKRSSSKERSPRQSFGSGKSVKSQQEQFEQQTQSQEQSDLQKRSLSKERSPRQSFGSGKSVKSQLEQFEEETQSQEQGDLQKRSLSKERSPRQSFGSGKSAKSQQEKFEEETQSQEQSDLQKRSLSKEKSPRQSFGSGKSIKSQQEQPQSQEQGDLQKRSLSKERSPRQSFGSGKSVKSQQQSQELNNLQRRSLSKERSPKHSFGSGKSVQSHLSTPRQLEQTSQTIFSQTPASRQLQESPQTMSPRLSPHECTCSQQTNLTYVHSSFNTVHQTDNKEELSHRILPNRPSINSGKSDKKKYSRSSKQEDSSIESASSDENLKKKKKDKKSKGKKKITSSSSISVCKNKPKCRDTNECEIKKCFFRKQERHKKVVSSSESTESVDATDESSDGVERTAENLYRFSDQLNEKGDYPCFLPYFRNKQRKDTCINANIEQKKFSNDASTSFHKQEEAIQTKESVPTVDSFLGQTEGQSCQENLCDCCQKEMFKDFKPTDKTSFSRPVNQENKYSEVPSNTHGIDITYSLDNDSEVFQNITNHICSSKCQMFPNSHVEKNDDDNVSTGSVPNYVPCLKVVLRDFKKRKNSSTIKSPSKTNIPKNKTACKCKCEDNENGSNKLHNAFNGLFNRGSGMFKNIFSKNNQNNDSISCDCCDKCKYIYNKE